MEIKTMPLRAFATLLTGALLVRVSMCQEAASVAHLSQCIRMAEPLVQNPDFIFPLTKKDIGEVCSMWDGFVDCVHEYTTSYLSDAQRKDFNKAIESSIESIHQLCVEDPDYQRMYMAYAPCMKRVSIEPDFCGSHYSYLANLVQTNGASDVQLCCAHQNFRNCVLNTTPLQCDAGGVAVGSGNSVSQFMKDMLDRALGFLLQKCRDSYYGPDECPSVDTSLPDGNSLKPGATDTWLSTTNSPDSDTRRSQGTSQNANQITPKPVGPSINLAGGNGLLGAESQEFRGSGTVSHFVPVLSSLILTLALVLQF